MASAGRLRHGYGRIHAPGRTAYPCRFHVPPGRRKGAGGGVLRETPEIPAEVAQPGFFVERDRHQAAGSAWTIHRKAERGQHSHPLSGTPGGGRERFPRGYGRGHSRRRPGGHHMDKNAVVEIVDRFRRGLEERGIRPQKVILDGSFLTGVATAERE